VWAPIRYVTADLQREHEVNTSDFLVLEQLAEAGGRRLKMGALADLTALTGSAITRIGRYDPLSTVGRKSKRPLSRKQRDVHDCHVKYHHQLRNPEQREHRPSAGRRLGLRCGGFDWFVGHGLLLGRLAMCRNTRAFCGSLDNPESFFSGGWE